MNRRRATAWFGLTASVIVCGAMAAGELLAGTAQDTPTTDVAPRAAPPDKVAQDRGMSGNPLWAVSLTSLTETSERPLFSASRRPPVPVVAAPPPRIEPVDVAPPPAPPARPPLDLVGTVTSPSERIAIFTNTTTSDLVRLRTGDDLDGWVLRSVSRREATLQKDSETAVLSLRLTGNAVPPAPAARIAPRPVAGIPPRPIAGVPPHPVAGIPRHLAARLSARLLERLSARRR